MHRMVGGIVLLLLAMPALRADDKEATPAEQYRALLKESQEEQQAFQKAVREAKTQEERIKLFRERNASNPLAPKFLALAEKYPKDPVAVDALIWVTTNTSAAPASQETRAKAIELLVRDHIQSEKLGRVCQTMAFGADKQNETFLRAVHERTKNPEVKAEACLALAQSLAQSGGADEAEALFKELVDQHIANLKIPRLIMVCQSLRYGGGKAGEGMLRTLLEKDARKEVQGAACLTLAQVLKDRADRESSADAKAADRLRDESEKLFEQAAEKYADVKLGRGTVGAIAKRELFDIRHLSVGKPAPVVEGEDQDGQKFKLADYKGKVVLLDFWSEF